MSQTLPTGMTPPKAPLDVAATISPSDSKAPSPAPSASEARSTHAAIPLPSMKPGEVITWVKLERPRFAIGEIIVSSFTIVFVIALTALFAGIVLGHIRSRRSSTHGTASLGLR